MKILTNITFKWSIGPNIPRSSNYMNMVWIVEKLTCTLKNLLYVEVSICSGSSFISTSNLIWTCNHPTKTTFQPPQIRETKPYKKLKIGRISYIIENLRVRSRWNKCNCKTFGAKPTSSTNLLRAVRKPQEKHCNKIYIK